MTENKIVNVINFVRGCEPREPERDIFEPVVQEIELVKKYGFENTFLLQYDVLISDRYVNLFKKEKDDAMEIGIWFECVRPLVESCGLKWRGIENYSWDWHVVPGFLSAYTAEEKRLMIDKFMSEFKDVFGYYPSSAGSWLLDIYSVKYMKEKYSVKAFVICREQYGVDAYTLWGGYNNQGYYPSVNNILCPGQTKSKTVQVPVFRMLGPDPIYCYDEREFVTNISGCATMEPVYEFGYNKEIFENNMIAYYKEECMNFAYTTIGQENSFGWDDIKKGLPMQLKLLDEMQKNGDLTVKKLCDTGTWFTDTFKGNPSVSLISHKDMGNNKIKSIWYNCKNYRVNLILHDDKLYFRDIHKFDENYRERYLDEPCGTWDAIYDTLPVVDGRMWNTDSVKSGLKFSEPITEYNIRKDNNKLIVNAYCKNGCINIALSEDIIEINKPAGVSMYFERGTEFDTKINLSGNTVNFEHNNYKYNVKFNCDIIETKRGYKISDNNEYIKLSFAPGK